MEAAFLVLQEAGMLVKVGHCSAVLFLAIAVASSLGLSGCDSNTYSAAIRYLVRTDPLVTTDKLGDERFNPDRPGQLPIFSSKDLLEFPNPYFKDAAQEKDDNFFAQRKMIDPTKLSADNRQKLQDLLDKYFGTPAEPKVGLINADIIKKLKLEPEQLAKGSHYYRIHCLHCHGVPGNGRGPTSRWINPHPRDYRQGLFKFQSVNQVGKADQKPSRADLMRTLEEGIEGTAMPAFNLLSTGDLESLVSYVIHLSIRGEAEFDTIKTNFSYNKDTDTLDLKRTANVEKYMKQKIIVTGQAWLEAQSDPIKVAEFDIKEKEMQESVQRGQELFLADEEALKKRKINVAASCVSCHKDYGRQANFRFDSWGTLVKPSDLTRGVYRGGRRPVDLYYRIHSGINGSGMANFGGNLTGQQIWDLVNFIRVLPYKAMRDKFGIAIN
jgi:mono/diheme cytochrome c family protein